MIRSRRLPVSERRGGETLAQRGPAETSRESARLGPVYCPVLYHPPRWASRGGGELAQVWMRGRFTSCSVGCGLETGMVVSVGARERGREKKERERNREEREKKEKERNREEREEKRKRKRKEREERVKVKERETQTEKHVRIHGARPGAGSPRRAG